MLEGGVVDEPILLPFGDVVVLRGDEEVGNAQQFRLYILVQTYIWYNRKTIAEIPFLPTNYLVISVEQRHPETTITLVKSRATNHGIAVAF